MRQSKTLSKKLQIRITCTLIVLVIIIFQFSSSVVANTDQTIANSEVPAVIEFKQKVESMMKAGVGPVIYPHKLHEEIYECSDCHPRLFKEKIGANDMNMQKSIDGQHCGSSGCHNSAEAFPLYLCENCHSEVTGVPKSK